MATRRRPILRGNLVLNPKTSKSTSPSPKRAPGRKSSRRIGPSDHRTWWVNYNTEKHYAHRERQDGRHSPASVLRGVLGRTFPRSCALACAVRHAIHGALIDRHGFVKFKHWRFYG